MKRQSINSDFDSNAFLQQTWQKRPALLPNLIPGFIDPLSAEELAGLACEELVESRIVTLSETKGYSLRNGPFVESDFTSLPSSDWTLLVQAVDQWADAVADLKQLFDFLPSWRIDDIMISFAAPGGGVGPHFDYYDVFLIQGCGRRRWQVGERCNADEPLLTESDLRLLENFRGTMEFELTAGDALYIPPRFPHWGIASEDSLCYSVGFRAPSMAEMIEGFSDFVMKAQDPSERYEDEETSTALRSGEIASPQLDSSFRRLTECLSQKEKFTAWFGCYVSQPKYPELIEPLSQELSSEEFASLVSRGTALVKNPSSRFAFIDAQEAEPALLFVDGAMVAFEKDAAEHIAQLCNVGTASLDKSTSLLTDPRMAELLRRLLNQGSLLLSE